MLTLRQHELLDFIIRYQDENGGQSPTGPEMAEHLQLRGKSGIVRLLDALQKRGFIKRRRYFIRFIVVLKRPAGVEWFVPDYSGPTPVIQRVEVSA